MRFLKSSRARRRLYVCMYVTLEIKINIDKSHASKYPSTAGISCRTRERNVTLARSANARGGGGELIRGQLRVYLYRSNFLTPPRARHFPTYVRSRIYREYTSSFCASQLIITSLLHNSARVISSLNSH